MAADSSALMQQGIALLNENSEASLRKAVALFDEAIALRRILLVPGDHWMAYLLAASWMNRGDAMTRAARFTPGAPFEEALRSYDEAAAVLRDVPLDANPLYRRRKAIAWMNRGITLQEQGTVESCAEAVRSFELAIETVRDHPEHVLLSSCAWMNRGNALLRLDPPPASEVRDCAAHAFGLLAGLEEQDVAAAEASLKARHVFCQAVAELLANASSPPASTELLSIATDAVVEGLRLARKWEERGETCFRPLFAGLFRFGVSAYQLHQPQFLADFVLDHLDPKRAGGCIPDDADLYAAASEALTVAAGKLHHDGFASLNTPRFDQLLAALRAQRFTEDRIRDLQDSRDRICP